MEIQARELVERQSERLGDYSDVQAQVRIHLDETKTQLRWFEEYLEACGESRPTLKGAAQSLGGNVMAMMHAGDVLLFVE